MMMIETTQCSNRPAKGALNGLLLAQNLENGKMPSRPSSCTTIGYVKTSSKSTESWVKRDSRTSTLREDDT